MAFLLVRVGVLGATTLSVVPIFEPLSLKGTDGDGDFSEIGEALQATVAARPMALSGAFPETLVEAVHSSHRLPTNDPNYAAAEVNLLVLCRVGLGAEMQDSKLRVKLDVSSMEIPAGIDLTRQQVIKLAIVAIRKTLEAYQAPQPGPLGVVFEVVGSRPEHGDLTDLGGEIEIGGS
jgi:hypothetical protein